MISRMMPRFLPLQEKIAGFAAKEVACRADQFNSGAGFPIDVWHNMGEEGLLSLNIPKSRGGMGCDSLCTMTALETFVRHGKGIGLAFSWLIHLILSRYLIMEFGTEEQKDRILPELASGKMIASLAMSEPGAGAHPKHLKTSALADGNGCFTLNGEKSFLTNGPIADLFIVFAITSNHAGRKSFGAFLVERNTPGLSFTPEFDLGCLYPSTHCGMRLEGCRVPASSILGERHSAYEQMAKPFRALEDVLLTSLALGGMEVQLGAFVNHMRRQDPHHSDEVKIGLGELRSLLDSLRVLVTEIGRLAEADGMESPEVLSLVLSFRHWFNHYQLRFEQLRNQVDEVEDSSLNAITRDLVRMASIAKNVLSIKQGKIGESLLWRKEPDAELKQ